MDQNVRRDAGSSLLYSQLEKDIAFLFRHNRFFVDFLGSECSFLKANDSLDMRVGCSQLPTKF